MKFLNHHYRVATGSFEIYYPEVGKSVIPPLLDAYQSFESHQPLDASDKKNHFNIVVVEGQKADLYPADFTEENRQEEDGQLIVSGIMKNGLKGFRLKIETEIAFLLSMPDYSLAILYLSTGVWQKDRQTSRLRGVMDTSLMLLYALRVAQHDALLFHASTVVLQGKAYLFLGKSGTGKSTHSKLWLKHIKGASLLNDDNPVVYISEEGTPMVSGSPWSGKTPCYLNEHYPIGGVVLLHQAPKNEIRKLSIPEAYVAIRSSVSGKVWEKNIANGQHATIEKIIKRCSIYGLDCLPNENAALLCCQYQQRWFYGFCKFAQNKN